VIDRATRRASIAPSRALPRLRRRRSESRPTDVRTLKGGASRPAIWLRAMIFAPLATVASGIVFLNLVGIAFQLWSSAPKSPWDAALTVVAARRLQALPIYSDAASDQASTMYGPIVPILTSWLFQIFGVSNRAGKLLTLTASLCVVGLVLVATARRDLRTWIVAGALLFTCNHNARFYFVEARPDMVAALFAVVALFLFAAWEQHRRVVALVGSVAFFVLTFFTKQPLAAVALVPFCAEAFRPGRMSRDRAATFLVAALPLVAVFLAILCLLGIDPMAFRYMVALPAEYPVPPMRVLQLACSTALLSAPMLLLALGLAQDCLRSDTRTRWWAAATTVFFVSGVVAMSKDGGTWNSLLPFTLASSGLLTLQIPQALTLLDHAAVLVRDRVVVSVVLAAILATIALPRPADLRWDVVGVHGDRRYDSVVTLARNLPGLLRCPEDPTIPLLARGEITRSAYLEMDFAHWPIQLPAGVEHDIGAARFLIQVRGGLPLLTDDELTRRGFVPVKADGLPEGGAYRLWTRATESEWAQKEASRDREPGPAVTPTR